MCVWLPGLKQARIKELNNVITELEGVRSQAHLQSQLQRDDRYSYCCVLLDFSMLLLTPTLLFQLPQ